MSKMSEPRTKRAARSSQQTAKAVGVVETTRSLARLLMAGPVGILALDRPKVRGSATHLKYHPVIMSN